MPSIAPVAISYGSTVFVLVFLAKTVRASLEFSNNSSSPLNFFQIALANVLRCRKCMA